jgi:hypothetical protein
LGAAEHAANPEDRVDGFDAYTPKAVQQQNAPPMASGPGAAGSERRKRGPSQAAATELPPAATDVVRFYPQPEPGSACRHATRPPPPQRPRLRQLPRPPGLLHERDLDVLREAVRLAEQRDQLLEAISVVRAREADALDALRGYLADHNAGARCACRRCAAARGVLRR